MLVHKRWYLIVLASFALAFVAVAQDHHHPPQDEPIDEKFYSTWFMPDNPSRSCCNKADCYPTIARFKDKQWWAQRREDAEWLPIPWPKVEMNRDNRGSRAAILLLANAGQRSCIDFLFLAL